MTNSSSSTEPTVRASVEPTVRMAPVKLKVHNKLNLILCLFGTYFLFMMGSATVLSVLPTSVLPESVARGPLVFSLAFTLTILITPIAVLLSFCYMYFFGGILSTKAMKLYLLIMRGKHVVTPRKSEVADMMIPKGIHLKLRRQFTYFFFILVVILAFATYVAKRRTIPLVSPLQPTADVASLISGDFVTLTMSASLMLPIVTLALPYFGGLRIRSIDTGPFHKTLITLILSSSGGFSLLYALIERPVFPFLAFYIFLFMGVCWCFALGCNLAAEPANRSIARSVLSKKPGGRVTSSRIFLQDAFGHMTEV